jgi:hypothetical protein
MPSGCPPRRWTPGSSSGAWGRPGTPPITTRGRPQYLEEGLALFRGEAYAEFADEEWAFPEASRLAELRAQARELWAQAALRTGPPGPVMPAASELTREYPLREEGWRLLALAQWGAGR